MVHFIHWSLQKELKESTHIAHNDFEAWGGGVAGRVTPIDWDIGCAIFLGYFFAWKINFWVYFIACNKFLGQDFSLE